MTEAWPDYIGRFHRERPGITEALLSRAVDERGAGPYAWVTGSLTPDGPMLDVGCGSAPTEPLVDRWVGVDASSAELATARQRGRGPLIVACAEALPIKGGGLREAVAVMTLMVFDDPLAAAHELTRVTAPAGRIALLVPTDSPLTVADRVLYTLLLAVLGRTAVLFPSPAAVREPCRVLRHAGLVIIEDRRRRFSFALADDHDAELFIDGLYLRGVSPWRVRLARGLLRRWPAKAIGIPLRRVVARVPPLASAAPTAV